MAPEKRMFTVRNLVAAQDRRDGHVAEVFEYEVFAEVPVEGELRVGPFALTAWDAEQIPAGRQRSLILSIENHLQDVQAPGQPSKAGFYHGISMPAEFCALATAFARRRITLGSLLRANGLPLRMKTTSRHPHEILAKGVLKLKDLDNHLDLLARLPPEYHQVFILACRMYQESLALIDDKPDLAYLLLVSCIEVFVGRLSKRTTESDLADDIRNALAKCVEDDARKVLLKRILDLDRGIARNFVSFIEEYVTPEFWAQSPNLSPERGRIEQSELRDLLSRIYEQRSRTVHEADPFPPNVMEPPDGLAEIDRRSELVVGQRKWTQRQIIPYVSFFERLVNHVLMTFLGRHATPIS